MTVQRPTLTRSLLIDCRVLMHVGSLESFCDPVAFRPCPTRINIFIFCHATLRLVMMCGSNSDSSIEILMKIRSRVVSSLEYSIAISILASSSHYF